MIIDAHATDTVPSHEVRRRAQEALTNAGEPMSEVTYDALRKRIAEAEAKVEKMSEVMELALRYFEDRIDVNDGDYGVSEANREMVLYNHMKKVLDNE